MLDRTAASLAAFSLIAMSACEPCSGILTCRNAPRVAIQGRIVDVIDGHGLSNVRIWLIRTSTDFRDSVSTTTNSDGNYSLALDAESGPFDVEVQPPNAQTYRVRDLALLAKTRTGDATVLGTWVNIPIFGTALELVLRRTGQLLTSGTVTFRRTGGVTMTGPNIVDDTFTAPIDASGRVALLSGARAGGADDVIGDLSVTLPGALGVTVLKDVHVQPDYEFRPQHVLRLAVGPELRWVVTIYNRATVAAVPNARVTFHRTGGLAISPETFSGITDERGELGLQLVPSATGIVVGDLNIEPPSPLRGYTKTNIELPTFDADGPRYLPPMGVGPHLPWAGVVLCDGRSLSGATITAVRVGGIDATPTRITSTSNTDGRFSLMFKPSGYGELIVDLDFTVPPESGCLGAVEHNLRLPTLDFDSGERFIRAWDLPKR